MNELLKLLFIIDQEDFSMPTELKEGLKKDCISELQEIIRNSKLDKQSTNDLIKALGIMI